MNTSSEHDHHAFACINLNFFQVETEPTEFVVACLIILITLLFEKKNHISLLKQYTLKQTIVLRFTFEN